jgi:hypothetical protein
MIDTQFQLMTDKKSHCSTSTGSVHLYHLSGNFLRAEVYQALGILQTELPTPLSKSLLVRNFLSQSGPFI